MKTIRILQLSLACAATVSTGRAIDLKEAKITQVVNDVQIISAASSTQKAAALNDVFTMPDILQTGPASRAELVAADETVTRVGANTIFSFDPATRTIDLKQGSLLFHSPHGKGGGTIHTGSATASVLGTTLIVTTTRDGGMKVLDLEGKVEVNTSHKLKQKLLPGQMTFLLPGGKQLAPIVVFRLDQLIRNSLLVHGFGQPLASMPLIQNQTDHQEKLIKTGHASDTGLLVGDKATADGVEVLDPNTIQTTDNRIIGEGLQAALSQDANISTPSLTGAGIPTPPSRLFLTQPFTLEGNSFFAGKTFRGFAARNINFNPAAPMTIDMTAYAGNPEFDFVAAGDLDFNGSVTFSGLPAGNTLGFFGGSSINFNLGSYLEADVAQLNLSTPGAITMNDAKIRNNVGMTTLVSGTSITMNNSAIYAPGGVTLTAPQSVTFTWDRDARFEAYDPTHMGDSASIPGVYGSLRNNINTDPTTGRVTLSAAEGLDVGSTSFRAHFLTMNSGGSILLYANGQTFKATGPGSVASFTANSSITATLADLSSYASVNMAANTITLTDTALGAGSTDTFRSLYGVLNVSGSTVFGDVNLFNVTYGGKPAQNCIVNAGSGPGIVVGTLSGTSAAALVARLH